MRPRRGLATAHPTQRTTTVVGIFVYAFVTAATCREMEESRQVERSPTSLAYSDEHPEGVESVV